MPFSSTIAIGVALIPPKVNVTICSSGKALPIASPSIIGRPNFDAAAKGIVEFKPPASMHKIAATGLVSIFSIIGINCANSLPEGNFSTITVGAPIIAIGKINASSGKDSISITSTPPDSFMLCCVISRPTYGSPPPPEPRTAPPKAIAFIDLLSTKDSFLILITSPPLKGRPQQ